MREIWESGDEISLYSPFKTVEHDQGIEPIDQQTKTRLKECPTSAWALASHSRIGPIIRLAPVSLYPPLIISFVFKASVGIARGLL